jgi:hypothetical protein
MKNTSTQDSS